MATPNSTQPAVTTLLDCMWSLALTDDTSPKNSPVDRVIAGLRRECVLWRAVEFCNLVYQSQRSRLSSAQLSTGCLGVWMPTINILIHLPIHGEQVETSLRRL